MSDFTDLTLYETRVLGALIEKAITTPDQYPLSLNALTTACNQKSNREPVLDLEEAIVQETVDGLVKRRLVTEVIGYGSRARTAKYQHRFCNTEFSALRFSAQELGIICVLFLRGPQTPGELRSRTSRLCKFEDVQEVEATLEGLIANSSGPFVVQLPREPGKRENRYAHLFSGQVSAADTWPAEAPGAGQPPSDRLAALEQRLEAMQAEIDELRGLVDELYS